MIDFNVNNHDSFISSYLIKWQGRETISDFKLFYLQILVIIITIKLIQECEFLDVYDSILVYGSLLHLHPQKTDRIVLKFSDRYTKFQPSSNPRFKRRLLFISQKLPIKRFDKNKAIKAAGKNWHAASEISKEIAVSSQTALR